MLYANEGRGGTINGIFVNIKGGKGFKSRGGSNSRPNGKATNGLNAKVGREGTTIGPNDNRLSRDALIRLYIKGKEEAPALRFSPTGSEETNSSPTLLWCPWKSCTDTRFNKKALNEGNQLNAEADNNMDIKREEHGYRQVKGGHHGQREGQETGA